MSAISTLHGTLRRIPGGVWKLGFVSLLMDVSSEMIHSLLPLFMVSVLGANFVQVGLIEGIAESVTLLIKVFSGAFSDYLGRRKGLAVFGYGLSALAKPLFALAGGLGMVFAARCIDRVGKGIRGAPRDAMLADLTPAELRGAAYGLRQALDTLGAFLGPLLAVALVVLWADDFRSIFWMAAIPAMLAVFLLQVGIEEQGAPAALRANPLARARLRQLPAGFWWVVGTGALFTLARFSEAFLILRVNQFGLPLKLIPLVLVLMNLVYALSAYPFGWLSDRMDHRLLLALGMAALILADLLLGTASHLSIALLGVALWGLHMGMTQGLLASMVAATSPANLRGTAFGLFNLVSGVAMLIASAGAGFAWQFWGAATAFYIAAGFSAAGLLALLLSTLRVSPR
ncbi:MFS transporter [Pseudomonas knackmussii]|uniref:MFS transporter n=1 Tax=Pseudomonas knackmussii TaxID=65741 RepID=UPI003F4A04E5